jgi:pimeloyl-ACP methyl ester carboxylesterase
MIGMGLGGVEGREGQTVTSVGHAARVERFLESQQMQTSPGGARGRGARSHLARLVLPRKRMLHVSDSGSGSPLLLVHGLPSPPEELVRLGASVPGRRAIVPSLPGYAGSPPAPGKHGVASIESELLALLSVRGIDAIDVVGFSMGSYRAIRLALSGRVRVRSLTLLGGFADLSADERDGMRGFAGVLREGALPPGLFQARMLSKAGAAVAEHAEAVEAWGALASPPVLIEELEDVAAAPSLLDRVGELEIPITLRVGTEDAAIPPRHSEAIARVARHATLEIVDGMGHALLVEDFDETSRSLQRSLLRARP